MKILTLVALIMSVLLLTGETNSLKGQVTDNKNQYQDSVNSDTIAAVVNVRFMVNKSGQVKKVRAVSIECEICDKEFKKQLKKEAVRIVSSMPDWTSDDDGKPRNVWFNLPIIMVLKDYE